MEHLSAVENQPRSDQRDPGRACEPIAPPMKQASQQPQTDQNASNRSVACEGNEVARIIQVLFCLVFSNAVRGNASFGVSSGRISLRDVQLANCLVLKNNSRARAAAFMKSM